MASRIKVLAIKSDHVPLDIDEKVTPKGALFRVQGLTKASISHRLSRDVHQLYEYVEDGDGDVELCSIDESVLSSLEDGTTIYALLAEEQTNPEEDNQQHSSAWHEQDVLAAHLCTAIYAEDPMSYVNQVKELKCIDSCNVSCHGDVKFLIADAGPYRFVAVRGSVSIRDWQQSFKLLPLVPICGGFLHQGFAQYSEFFSQDAISSWVQHGSPKQVIVAGHSLGGALASIVALRGLLSLSPAMAQNGVLRAVTFGAPFYATGQVSKSIDGKGWKKYFRNYVLENDPVPRLLNVHPQHALFGAVASALFRGTFAGLDVVASKFVQVQPEVPQYSPLGLFIYLEKVELHSAGDSEYRINDYHLRDDSDVMTKLGKPALTGEWGMTGCQQHGMASGYLQYLSKLRAPTGILKLFEKTKQLIGTNTQLFMGTCAGRNKTKKLSVGQSYEYKRDDQYVLVSIKSDNGDGTYAGICLDSSREELENIVPAKAREVQIAPCTLNVLMSTRTVDGMTVPTNVQITSEVTEANHIATSLLWLCDLTIEGLEFRTKKLRITLLDSAGRLRLHFNGDFTIQSAQHWQAFERPLEVKAFHMFHNQPFKFTREDSDYKLRVEKPLGALSPLENILDTESPFLMSKAFHRVVLEAFLGEPAALPQKSRVKKLQSIKLFRYLVTLEMLSEGTRSIDQFMTENLSVFPSKQPNECTDALRSLLDSDVPELADRIFPKIAKFVFASHSIAFPRRTIQKVLTATGALALGAGLTVLACAAAPAIYYGGIAAALADVSFGAAGVGAGSLGLWLGKPDEHATESYKQILTSFVEQLGGDPASVQQTCLSLEEKIEELVLSSELMNNDEINKKLFRDREFTANRDPSLLSSHSMEGIWKSIQDRLCICDSTSKSKELAARHIFTAQLVRSIRLELLDTVYIAVLGMQNAGKSTFIKQIWPHCQVEGVGGGSNHTVVAKPLRVNNEVVVVDFPGINDWEQIGFMSKMFMGMATFAVVVLKCEDIELHGRQFLAEVRDYFSPEQILVFITHADRFPDMIPDSRSVKELRRTYASKERLNFNHEQIFLTAMLAVDDEGHPSEEKLMRCVAKGINGPREVHDQLQVALSKLLRRPVSLDAAS